MGCDVVFEHLAIFPGQVVTIKQTLLQALAVEDEAIASDPQFLRRINSPRVEDKHSPPRSP
jgi:hypothetical protein